MSLSLVRCREVTAASIKPHWLIRAYNRPNWSRCPRSLPQILCRLEVSLAVLGSAANSPTTCVQRRTLKDPTSENDRRSNSLILIQCMYLQKKFLSRRLWDPHCWNWKLQENFVINLYKKTLRNKSTVPILNSFYVIISKTASLHRRYSHLFENSYIILKNTCWSKNGIQTLECPLIFSFNRRNKIVLLS